MQTADPSEHLHYTIDTCNVHKLSLLLSSNNNTSNTILPSALHRASSKGRHKVVNFLLHKHVTDEVDANYISEGEDSPLRVASENGHAHVVSVLLTFGEMSPKGLKASEVAKGAAVQVWELWNNGGTKALTEGGYPVFTVPLPTDHLLFRDYSEIQKGTCTDHEHHRQVTVAHFNTLADWLSDAFPYADKAILTWEYRKNNLIDAIIGHTPDIVALVECDHFSDWFQPKLGEEGYDGIFHKKPQNPDGTAIFWQRSKYKIINQFYTQYESDNQGLVVAHLEHVDAPGSGLCIAATHLKAKEEFGTIRERQTKLLVQIINKFNADKNWPVIILGDFNAKPDSTEIQYFSTMYSSSYDLSNKDHWTSWKKRTKETKFTIDYVWYDANKLTLTHVLPPPPDTACSVLFPASYWPSDHLLIGAKFSY